MAVSPTLALSIFVAGAVAGSLGALLGIGGGVFLVPFLTLGLGLPFTTAAAISLTTVIATSSSVSGNLAGRQLINLRFGMMLEVATVAKVYDLLVATLEALSDPASTVASPTPA